MRCPAAAPGISDRLEIAKERSRARAGRGQRGAVAAQPHSAGTRSLAGPHRFMGDENRTRCVEQTLYPRGKAWPSQAAEPLLPPAEVQKTHGHHELLQEGAALCLSRCRDPLHIPHPLMDAGTFQTTASTPCPAQTPLFSNTLNGHSLENKEQQSSDLPAAYS